MKISTTKVLDNIKQREIKKINYTYKYKYTKNIEENKT